MTREELDAAGDWAFPSGDGEYGGGPNHCYGMTLRDWFAGQALIAVASRWQGTIGDIDDDAQDRSALIAYEIADAMLKARTPSRPIPSEGG